MLENPCLLNGEYDQEVSQSQTVYQPKVLEEKTQNIKVLTAYCYKLNFLYIFFLKL